MSAPSHLPAVGVTHELEVTCSCPMDNTLDRYDVVISVRRTLPVEDILSAVEALPSKAFQEDITARLAKVLGARVTTRGVHSGIVTTCTA